MSLPYAGNRRKNIGQSLLLIFLLGLAIYILFNSSFFELEDIRVKGNHRVKDSKIIDVSGLNPGVNIFKLSSREAARNLEVIPMLKEINVERDLPGTVVISVKERRPVALLPAEKGFIEIDGEGICLRQNRAAGTELPVITGVDYNSRGPGKNVRGTGLEPVLKVIDRLPSALTSRLSEIHYAKEGTIILYTLQGVQCRMGLPHAVARKGEVFWELLKTTEAQDKKILYADLSSVDAPVIKYEE